MIQWRAGVNAIMNVQVPYQDGICRPAEEQQALQERFLHHVVINYRPIYKAKP
jgi:hypothetical protein